VRSAAITVVPLPRKASSTMSPRGRAVEDRIGDHGDRFHGRVQIQQIALLPMAAKELAPG